MRFTNIILTLTLIAVSCRQKEKLYTDAQLKDKIEKTVTSGQKVLDLGVVADFDWDSLLIITPYANFDDTEENLDIDLSGIEHVNMGSRDDISQLIFYYHGEPTKMVEYPRYPGDFAFNKIEFTERDSAKYNIIVTIAEKTGADWLTLEKRR